MKNIITGLVAIAAFTFSANAQTDPNNDQNSGNYGRSHRGEGRNKMMEKLNLSRAQKDQLKLLNEDYHTKMQNLRQNSSLSDADMKTQRQNLEEDRKTRMAAVLTPSQRTQWMQMEKEGNEDNSTTGQWNNSDQNSMRNGKNSNDRWDNRMDNMKQELGLSDDQMMKMQSGNESFRSRTKAIFDNQSLSQEDRKEQLEKLRMERMETMHSILTPDQYTKMQSMNQGRKEKIKDENGKIKIKEKN